MKCLCFCNETVKNSTKISRTQRQQTHIYNLHLSDTTWSLSKSHSLTQAMQFSIQLNYVNAHTTRIFGLYLSSYYLKMDYIFYGYILLFYFIFLWWKIYVNFLSYFLMQTTQNYLEIRLNCIEIEMCFCWCFFFLLLSNVQHIIVFVVIPVVYSYTFSRFVSCWIK